MSEQQAFLLPSETSRFGGPGSRSIAWLDQRLYPRFASRWDDQALHALVGARLECAERVLDLGAGAGGVSTPFSCRARGRIVHGVDLDRRVATNPSLDAPCLGDIGALPYRSGSFDLIFSNNVLEHLTEPHVAFREVSRVLKPGGRFVFKTPNRNHYVATLARATPHTFHQLVNQRRGRRQEDTFPTRYGANTAGALRRLAAGAGLTIETMEFIEGRPEYGRLHPLLYLAAAGYERIVNAWPRLSRFRVVIVGCLRKPSGGP